MDLVDKEVIGIPQLERLQYIDYSENLLYVFPDKQVPNYIGFVPLVTEYDSVNIELMNGLYATYTTTVDTDVEGFVVNNNNSIRKYVRMKSGKLEDHKQ